MTSLIWAMAALAGSKRLALPSQSVFRTNICDATSIFISDPLQPGDLDKISLKLNTSSPLFPEPQDSTADISGCA